MSVFIEDFLQPKSMKHHFRTLNQAVWTGDSNCLNSSVCTKIPFLSTNQWSVFGPAKTHNTTCSEEPVATWYCASITPPPQNSAYLSIWKKFFTVLVECSLVFGVDESKPGIQSIKRDLCDFAGISFSFFKPSIKDLNWKNFAVPACFPTHVVSHIMWGGAKF